MMQALRLGALAIALGGIVDPAFAVRRAAPIPVEMRLPPAGDPAYARAADIRRAFVAAAGESIATDSAEPAAAVVVIGGGDARPAPGVPFFAIALTDTRPALRIVDVKAPRAYAGQQVVVRAKIRGVGLNGRAADVALIDATGAVVASARDTWRSDDELREVELGYAPAAAIEVLRVRVASDGADTASADVAAFRDDRRPRVFVYEPRPSWAVSFARQALESDVLFDVRALARTSRGIDTRSGSAPASLAALDPEGVDVIVAGGLDAITTVDLEFLRRFVGDRGGRLVLVPDGAVPEPVRAAFDLPAARVTLVEKPTDLAFGALRIRASETLGSRAVVEHGPVTLVAALDAWRYRDDGFNEFWRGLVADAAATAVPKLEVTIEPALTRPGENVTVRARVRMGAESSLPPVSASLVSATGGVEAVRLWPGTAAGEFLGAAVAASPGQYDVRVRVGEDQVDRVLVVKADVVQTWRERSSEPAALAQASGGAAVTDRELATVVERLRGLPAPAVERRVHPMRSPWWAAGFAALLAGEWALRRRRGLR